MSTGLPEARFNVLLKLATINENRSAFLRTARVFSVSASPHTCRQHVGGVHRLLQWTAPSKREGERAARRVMRLSETTSCTSDG